MKRWTLPKEGNVKDISAGSIGCFEKGIKKNVSTKKKLLAKKVMESSDFAEKGRKEASLQNIWSSPKRERKVSNVNSLLRKEK